MNMMQYNSEMGMVTNMLSDYQKMYMGFYFGQGETLRQLEQMYMHELIYPSEKQSGIRFKNLYDKIKKQFRGRERRVEIDDNGLVKIVTKK